ncbi:HelD family protein [Chromohalobacter sarecensis]|uniref:HelD family protein n=1 Tax=Chromohalobacter sarecensis TaxID=245294 RepID=A0ABV9D0T5_9GAMM|nr:3'-5' exonuclease [Chromohalobacter sarecensis]MCK0713643.1 AAA family ATPase [Chromohalobacter sarecensis]
MNAPRHASAREQEATHLETIQSRLINAIDDAEARLSDYKQDIQEQKTYLAENRDEMDHIEKISSRESIDQMVKTGDALLAQKGRLEKLQRAPYFGRFDFRREGEREASPIYIGIHHFQDHATNRTHVYDWRAPIASLFYDYETGPVRFTAPEGDIEGQISLKRQFRIQHDTIELMIDSEVNVVDEVLQDELGRASDANMKNIVATIQRDQNAIIRNDEAPVLIIQGVAGSGKTSIALHRIAFLLYRFKDTLSSDDILIVSPNSVFADYISTVLPELGEESVNEVSMESLADTLLEGEFRFQGFFEQTRALLEKQAPELQRRVAFKASAAMLEHLDAYLKHVENQRFAARDVWIEGRLIPAWLIEEAFHRHASLAQRDRLERVIRDLEASMQQEYRYALTPDDRQQLQKELGAMAKTRRRTLRQTYKAFYEWLEEPALFKPGSHGRLEYNDLFPLIYLKMKLERISSPYARIKHLLIDEMQDYTPVQYAVLNRLFSCKKTILGDARQSVDPYSASSLTQIRRTFLGSICMTLNKSYRSSYEIMQFTQRISHNPDLVAIERHDEAPRVLHFTSRRQEAEGIIDEAHAFLDSSHHTLAVICKTQRQAAYYHEQLATAGVEAVLLDERSQALSRGIIVCTAHLAKGLEFDRVIVPSAEDKTYHNDMDRNLLYVACTRAMHRLTLTYTGQLSTLIEAASDTNSAS